MIVFDLLCSNGHTFEGWFDDSQSFECQASEGMVSCPYCEDTQVVKAATTFGIKKTSSRPASSEAQIDLDGLREEFTEFIENNFDNVGSDFAKEALKIHYGVSKPRNIRGSSTDEDEKMLKEEGVPFLKVPAIEPESTGD